MLHLDVGGTEATADDTENDKEWLFVVDTNGYTSVVKEGGIC